MDFFRRRGTSQGRQAAAQWRSAYEQVVASELGPGRPITYQRLASAHLRALDAATTLLDNSGIYMDWEPYESKYLREQAVRYGLDPEPVLYEVMKNPAHHRHDSLHRLGATSAELGCQCGE